MDSEKYRMAIMVPAIGMEWSRRGIPSLTIDLIFRGLLQVSFRTIDHFKNRGERCAS